MPERYDLTEEPLLKEQLLQARRGTAFFARKLNELSDGELDGSSLLPNWSRRHVIAHVGYNARAISRLVEWAATGVKTPMYESREARNYEIVYGATLSPIALRNLSEHAATHLNIEWRDLTEQAWKHQVRTAQGRQVPASETVWMRSREVWVHAVDLNNGADFENIPVEFLERLLTDITAAWAKRGEDTGLILKVDDTPTGTKLRDTTSTEATMITGALPAVTRWAAGRGTRGIDSNGTHIPYPPRWI